jgi:hypothetical protein
MVPRELTAAAMNPPGSFVSEIKCGRIMGAGGVKFTAPRPLSGPHRSAPEYLRTVSASSGGNQIRIPARCAYRVPSPIRSRQSAWRVAPRSADESRATSSAAQVASPQHVPAVPNQDVPSAAAIRLANEPVAAGKSIAAKPSLRTIGMASSALSVNADRSSSTKTLMLPYSSVVMGNGAFRAVLGGETPGDFKCHELYGKVPSPSG